MVSFDVFGFLISLPCFFLGFLCFSFGCRFNFPHFISPSLTADRHARLSVCLCVSDSLCLALCVLCPCVCVCVKPCVCVCVCTVDLPSLLSVLGLWLELTSFSPWVLVHITPLTHLTLLIFHSLDSHSILLPSCRLQLPPLLVIAHLTTFSLPTPLPILPTTLSHPTLLSTWSDLLIPCRVSASISVPTSYFKL